MKKITAETITEIVVVEDVRVSPDGGRIAFVRQSIDRSANETARSIWMTDFRGSKPVSQPFTAGRKDSSPRWTADGTRLGFITERNGDKGIYVIAVSGGEAQRAASHTNGVTSFEWSTDGKRIAFTSTTRADERAKEDEDAAKPAGGESEAISKDAWEKQRYKDQREHENIQRFDPRIVREFPYRSGTTFKDDRWSHIYVTDVPTTFASEKKVKALRVTDGDQNYVDPTWLHDGHAVIASLARHPEHTLIEYWDDMVSIDTESKAEAKTLLSSNYSYYHPVVSPDGQWVALQRILEEHPGFRDETLCVMPASGGELIDLTASLDRGVIDFVWSRDSAQLYFTLQNGGTVNLHRVNIATRVIEQLTNAVHEITSFDVDALGRVAYAASTPTDPSALYLREVDGSIIKLYEPNDKFLHEYIVCPTEAVNHTVEERTIQGWVITPPGFNPANKYPLALEIHGGPAAMWGAGTRSMWHEWQTLAQAGYVVYFCNPRGSGGYGEAFLRANQGNWGDGPMLDIMRGVDLVIERGYIDTERMVVTGGSYGGYLTAWVVGRTNRFKAAVAQRGVYNLISMRGVTDIPSFNDRETGTTPWDDVNKMWEMSPLALAPHVQTPLLLEHSELDYCVPSSQAEELYLALRSFKKTVELIRWSREGHELSRSGEPKHRIERIKRIVEWFGKYTAGA